MQRLLAFSLGVLCLLGLLTTSSVGAVEGGEARVAATPGSPLTPTRTPTPPFAYSPTGDWKQASPNGNIRSVFCLDDQRCWIGASDNADYGIRYGHLYDTRNGGRTWNTRQFTKTPSPVRFFDALHGTAGPYRTFDGGATWHENSVAGHEAGQFIWATSLSGYACVSGSAFTSETFTYRTEDGGATWNPWRDGCEFASYPEAQYVAPGIAWATRTEGGLLYTADGWKSKVQPPTGDPDIIVYGVHFSTVLRGWAAAGCVPSSV